MMSRVLVWGFSNNLAGTEAVVANYISAIRDTAFDVLTYEEPTNYASLFEGDNRFFLLPRKSQNPLKYARALHAHMRGHASEYAALWCNLNSRANIDVIKLAGRYGIPRIIAHSHNSMKVGGLRTRLLDSLNQNRFNRLVTDRWACSDVAGRYMFCGEPFRVLPNAIDYGKYAYNPEKGRAAREALGIGTSSRVVGTVGRMSEQKNHLWLYRMFSEAKKQDSDLHLLVIGDGERRSEELSAIRALGLCGCSTILFSSSSVSDLLSGMDVFVLPSLWEGLPVSLLEAQANGLPCIVSDAISPESTISDNIKYLSLDDADAWIALMNKCRRGEFSRGVGRAPEFDLSVQAGFLSECFSGHR